VQSAFINVTASYANTTASSVNITGYSDSSYTSRRRLASAALAVNFTVASPSGSGGSQLGASFTTALSSAAYVGSLNAAMPAGTATITGSAVISIDAAAPAPQLGAPAAASSAAPVGLMSGGGHLLFAAITALLFISV
jgi:hypothetical protein